MQSAAELASCPWYYQTEPGDTGFEQVLKVILRNLQRVVLIPQVLVLWFWARKYRVKNFRAFVHDVRVILRSGLFLAQYYRGASKNPKPGKGFFQQTRLISDFLVIGAKEEFDPNPLFSVRFYLNAYPDVRAVTNQPTDPLHIPRWQRGEEYARAFRRRKFYRDGRSPIDLKPSLRPFGDFLIRMEQPPNAIRACFLTASTTFRRSRT